MKGKTCLLVFLVMLPLLGWGSPNLMGAVEPRIFVDPPLVTANPGETFIVNVRVANIEDLWDYEFRVEWDPALLDVERVTEGTFLNAEGQHETFFIKKENFPSAGHLYVVCTLMGEPISAAASGSGVLANIEFRVLGAGNCTLDLYDPLLEEPPPEQNKIQPIVEDGVFKYPLTEIGPDPATIIDPSLVPNSTFNVNISIIRASEVYVWNLNMSWDPTVLYVTAVTEGSFLHREGQYNTTLTTRINQEAGVLAANCTLQNELPEASASGNGTLITVTFRIQTKGATLLRTFNTWLLDYEGVRSDTLTINGYFSSIARDVAIIGVSISPNYVTAGDTVTISIISKNEGDITFGQSVDVALYYNNSFLGTFGLSDLSPGSQKTLNVSWATKGLAEGTYIIRAVASPLLGETFIDNNQFTFGYLTITPAEQPFPLELVAAGAVILVIVAGGLGVFLLKRRR